MTTQRLSTRQQRIIDEMQNNELTAWVNNDGEIELVSFKRFVGLVPHLLTVRSLIKNNQIKCYDKQIRPGYLYDIWYYRLPE